MKMRKLKHRARTTADFLVMSLRTTNAPQHTRFRKRKSPDSFVKTVSDLLVRLRRRRGPDRPTRQSK